MSFVENLKKDVELINNFSSDFFDKTNTIGEKITTTMKNIDTVINDEKQNDIYLSNLEKKVDSQELKNILVSLKKYKESLETKYAEYNHLVEKNGKKIVSIGDTIRNNKEIIQNVYQLAESLQNTTTTIDSKVKKAGTVKTG